MRTYVFVALGALVALLVALYISGPKYVNVDCHDDNIAYNCPGWNLGRQERETRRAGIYERIKTAVIGEDE
jgi:hypothetical protein